MSLIIKLIVALIVIYGTMSPAHCSNNEPKCAVGDAARETAAERAVGRAAGDLPPRPPPEASRSEKKRVRFVSYLRARGDLEAHPNCFRINEPSTFQA